MASYLLALLAAVVNAGGNVLNRKAAREEPAEAGFRLRLITDLVRKKAWLASVAMMMLSFVLASAALGTGQLASVQLVVVLELPLTILGGSWLFKTRLSGRERAAVAALTGGVIGLLALLDPRPGPPHAVTPVLWVLGSVANAGAVIVLFLAARAHPGPGARAGFLGIATGLGYGLTAAYTKGMADLFRAGGISGVVSSWQLYACVIAGAASAWLLENAYQAGPLRASQPGITLVDPLISALWGVLVFGEQVRQGPLLALTAVPLAALATGVYLLSRCQILHTCTQPASRKPATSRTTMRGSGPPGQTRRR